MSALVKRTQTELVDEMKSRFGDDLNKWAFICPQCGDIATIQDFKDALAKDNDPTSDAFGYHGQVCIGRVTKGRGCDWAAYGLFSGPEFIIMDDGSEVPCFAIAPSGGDRL